ncbi:MAG: PTS sugar transporter subunit IIA [Treponema sp.]|jgi:PTS system nitrogen regulatory IIA component|nr:PTS sugar transporter subunit IIA [Treponema sp.]
MKTQLGKAMIFLRLKSRDKEGIINELLDNLAASGKLPDREAAHCAVMEREHKMSTGLKNGIGIPHGKTNTVDGLVACLGISDYPVEFESQDGQPCRIFIMTISRSDKTGPHLELLSEISMLLKSDERRAAILEAATPDEVWRILFAEK